MRQRAALAAWIIAVAGIARADERVIQYAKDALTVHLTNVPVAEVLDEIARQSGAEIRGHVRADGAVTAQFDAVPLPEALHRLLGDQNFALVYGESGKLKSVRLLGGTPGQTAAVAPAPVTPAVQPPASSPGLANLVANHAPVPVSGRLAQTVGGPNATLQQLFEIGTRNEDSSLRSEAIRTMVSTLETDPALRAATIGELGTIDDGALSAILRGAAGEHAEEVAMQVLTQARASEIRVKASSVLQRLRAGS
jgi:hypothetical protein